MKLKDMMKKVLPPSTAMVDRRFERLNRELNQYFKTAQSENESIKMSLDELSRFVQIESVAGRGSFMMRPLSLSAPLVVSVASYGKRLPYLPKMLDSLRNQTVQPEAILLWLPEKDFPDHYGSLPNPLLRALLESRAEVRWVADDLKSHNKYFYVMSQYPDCIVVTVDDDMCYSPNLIESLAKQHLRHPDSVIAMRTHRIQFSDDAEILPYQEWKQEQAEILDRPSGDLFPTGMAGVLYPPHALPAFAFNAEVIRSTCINADDLWLKVMTACNKRKVVQPSDAVLPVKHVPGSQETGLYHFNQHNGGNDDQLGAILSYLTQYGMNVGDVIAWMRG